MGSPLSSLSISCEKTSRSAVRPSELHSEYLLLHESLLLDSKIEPRLCDCVEHILSGMDTMVKDMHKTPPGLTTQSLKPLPVQLFHALWETGSIGKVSGYIPVVRHEMITAVFKPLKEPEDLCAVVIILHLTMGGRSKEASAFL